ncbi:MAG: SCP2 sterol-binding domain-containing protein [Luminiphilus sp.]|nr:SCP2 sterol-binding domain-containing protein [Luminiphilus sp.]
MEHDPAVIAGLSLAIETVIAKVVELSPGTKSQLKQLHPLTIEIHCTHPVLKMFVNVEEDGGIQIASYRETNATVSIEGTWRDFSRVATASDPAAVLINGDVKISGDTAPLMQLQTILGDLDIDWEAPIVNAIGPVFGHQLAEVIRAITRTSGTTHRRMKRQLSEFILEEGRLSPPKPELDSFFTAVDDLVLRTDRIESRLKRIKKRASSLTGVNE